MQLRPAIQIQSVIKALKEVVIPAVDPKNKLALEQVQLSIGLLALMAQQLPVQFQFDCEELGRLITLSGDLSASAPGATSEALAAAAADAARTLQAATVSPADIENAVRALREKSGALISEVFEHGTPASQSKVSALTLTMSKDQLLRERAMVLMQGWEVDPKSVPPLAQLLGLPSHS
jgi:hypothetical protein